MRHMEKKILIDSRAEKELGKFNSEARLEFRAYLLILKEKGRLGFPEGKKIDEKLFELRVRHKGEYRGFYAYIGKAFIIILHFFQKKTRKTPIKNIKTAKRRLSQYE